MNAVDTNIIVYAHRTDNTMHERALSFLEGVLPSGIGIPYHCLVEFVAIVTSPRIFKTPTPVVRAIEQVRTLLQVDGVRVLTESTESFESFARLLGQTNLSGASVHDVRIAAACLEHSVKVLYSLDRDFSRIPGLRVQNPLL